MHILQTFEYEPPRSVPQVDVNKRIRSRFAHSQTVETNLAFDRETDGRRDNYFWSKTYQLLLH